ncbi:PhzF family phenazine biosynthesis protein [Photobacterium sp. TY1-4]|uniref:PhzF family phenazine biosynthesis protein n=1 Tax=Photobacterium sp. TY1-4 TaxID=2899122 RepID=UPI0021C149C5|nr:PhzF family phenazine biosynthesis protein [Photobacterium sp. TY1-4]UXI02617.1 PhzF family phenazine biosynthesis protein [Photobacterium sp. TY1-4]
MKLDIYQVDSFTTSAFQGNPAGVCLTSSALTESQMRAIAAEMAVSEIAFLNLSNDQLRWFTPEVEVALCGHGTLAVAHVLKETGRARVGETVTFHTLSGALAVKIDDTEIEMDFPAARIVRDVPVQQPLIAHLGLNDDQLVAYGEFDGKVLIEVTDASVVRLLAPNFDGLKQLPGRSVLVTALSDEPGADCISRYFAPWVGVNEDPVTGSAHCALAPYWAAKLNKTVLRGYQASTRGGYVKMALQSDNRVLLAGQAVTVIQGTLLLPA